MAVTDQVRGEEGGGGVGGCLVVVGPVWSAGGRGVVMGGEVW